MKKILLSITTLLMAIVTYSQTPGIWTQKANFGGTARAGAVGFSIDSKGYIGMGNDGGFKKDFWEYNPSTDAWSQKADFGGPARSGATGFSIGSLGYVGTGEATGVYYNDFWEYNPSTNVWTTKANFGGVVRSAACGFAIGSKAYIGTGVNGFTYYKDFWEYDPATNTWTQKADLGGSRRKNAVGFSISGKGYIGTGFLYDGSDHFYTDLWEYDPSTNIWTTKASFGGVGREAAAGFSIGSKGYIGTGLGGTYPYKFYNDFWEYDAFANTWSKKADLGVAVRHTAVGFSIGPDGYIGTGAIGYTTVSYYKDFWKYTSGGCPAPSSLRVPKISDSCARLNWSVPGASVEHIKISYRPVGSSLWKVEQKKGGENAIFICGLTPSTTYEWEVKNICANGATEWVKGPNFTTRSSVAFSSNTEAVNGNNIQGNVSVQIKPNPSRGSFTLQLQLPAKASVTTLILYNSLGQKIWQQDAGKLSGSINKNIALESKLPAGVYVLMIEHGATRLMKKVVVTK